MRLSAFYLCAFVAALPFPKQGDTITLTLVSSHAGNADHIAPIKKIDNGYTIGGESGAEVHFILSPEGTLTDMDGSPVQINPETGMVTAGSEFPTTGFSVYNSYLVHQSMKSWHACPSETGEFVLSNDCPHGEGIGLYVTSQKSVKQ